MKKRTIFAAITTFYVVASIIMLYGTLAIHIGMVFPFAISVIAGLEYGKLHDYYVRLDEQLSSSNELYEGTGND